MIKKGLYECIRKDNCYSIYPKEIYYIRPSIFNSISKKINIIAMFMEIDQLTNEYKFARCKDIYITYQNKDDFFRFWKKLI